MRIRCLLLLLTSGCAVHYALPMTADSLVRYNTGPALVAYLGQPDASPSVCDPRSQGPHLTELTRDAEDALMQGLVEGKIQPALWTRCVKALLRGLPEQRAASLFDAQARIYWNLLRSSELEVDPAAGERLATVQQLYLERSADSPGHPQVLKPMVDEVREALAKGRLGPVARGFAQELLKTADVESGRWEGRDVTAAMMDGLAAAGNEMTLARFAERLPSPDLRREASRRLIRIHLALSPFPEVRAAAPAVEEAVLAQGYNRISLAGHPLARAWFGWEKSPIRSVLVRQDVWQQTATLLGYPADRREPSVLPELSLREALWAEVSSISRPVTVCGPKKDLDPTPCIDAADLSLEGPLAYLGRTGALHFNDTFRISDLAPLAAQEDFFLPVRIGGQPAASLHWGLVFERPESLVFNGSSTGARGPPLNVRVERPNGSHFVFTASPPAATYVAVVEAADLDQFRVESAGAEGESGSSGSDGSAGADGAECQDGSSGGNGGRGGHGGPGGDGGDVQVQIACRQSDCHQTVTLLEKVVLSLGGPGGEGGSGGRGGSGGSGGAARSEKTHTDEKGNVVVDDPGCSAGSSGSSGSDGSDGSDGRRGSPGRVSFTFNVVPE